MKNILSMILNMFKPKQNCMRCDFLSCNCCEKFITDYPRRNIRCDYFKTRRKLYD